MLEPLAASIDKRCVLVNQRIGVQFCPLSMYRYLKRVGIVRRKSTFDGTVSAPKPNRAVPTETSKRFLQTPKAGYGYTESLRDEGDGRRYRGAITNAALAFVATTDREGCGVGEKGGTQHRRQR